MLFETLNDITMNELFKEANVNTKTKKRLIVVSGIIIIVLVVVLALIGGNTAAASVSIAQATSGDYVDKKIQVSGNVVKDSFETKGNVLTFAIYDPAGDSTKHLQVRYDGAASTTFGNDVTAICTGKIDDQGILHATELVTKCPSKYENSTNALSVSGLLAYGEEVYDKPVKVVGAVKANSLKAAGQGDRFILVDSAGSDEFSVEYTGALSDEIKEGTTVIVTGSLNSKGKFIATDVALEG